MLIFHIALFIKQNQKHLQEGLGTGIKFICDNLKGIEECLKLESFILSIWNKLYKRTSFRECKI